MSAEKLISQWQSLVFEVSEGYELGFADYINDLYVREEIERVVGSVSGQRGSDLRKMVEELDQAFLDATISGERPLVVSDLAAERWWWRRAPCKVDDVFADELIAEGVITRHARRRVTEGRKESRLDVDFDE